MTLLSTRDYNFRHHVLTIHATKKSLKADDWNMSFSVNRMPSLVSKKKNQSINQSINKDQDTPDNVSSLKGNMQAAGNRRWLLFIVVINNLVIEINSIWGHGQETIKWQCLFWTQNGFSSTLKKHYIKLSAKVWEQREVFVLIADGPRTEKCIAINKV